MDGVVTGGPVLALIPARGGSKSIPRKNIRSLAGAPLVAWSIAAARQARQVDRVIVSTDDPDIADVARRCGAEVPFLRPAALAGDTTTDLPVFLHALDWLDRQEAWRPEIVVQLRPTSPLRPPDCVDAAITRLREDPATDSVRAVVTAGQTPYKMWRMQGGGLLAPLLDDVPGEAYNSPRQALPRIYWQTGHVDAIRSATIREQASMTGHRIAALLIDAAYTCDIDTETDWQRTEWQLARWSMVLVRPEGPDARLPTDVRLIVFDFDGVMTDNRVVVTETGEESVSCDRSDGLGLAQLRALGVPMLVLSTEVNPVVAARCRKLGLECEHGLGNKAGRLREILAHRGIDPRDVIYVGNDVNDLECLRLVGCAVVVADAHPDVRGAAHLVLTHPGGHGAVRELCDLVRIHVASTTTVR